jgi:cytochrome c
MRTIIIILLAGLLFGVPAAAAEKGTADEAKTLVDKGIAYVQSNGKEKAFSEFSNPKGQFVDRDLYIFVVDFNGITLAHGGNSKLVGKDMNELKDADGKFFIKECIEVVKTKGNGWVDYKWQNPVTKKIEPKSTYVQKNEDYFLGCGIYK